MDLKLSVCADLLASLSAVSYILCLTHAFAAKEVELSGARQFKHVLDLLLVKAVIQAFGKDWTVNSRLAFHSRYHHLYFSKVVYRCPKI